MDRIAFICMWKALVNTAYPAITRQEWQLTRDSRKEEDAARARVAELARSLLGDAENRRKLARGLVGEAENRRVLAADCDRSTAGLLGFGGMLGCE